MSGSRRLMFLNGGRGGIPPGDMPPPAAAGIGTVAPILSRGAEIDLAGGAPTDGDGTGNNADDNDDGDDYTDEYEISCGTDSLDSDDVPSDFDDDGICDALDEIDDKAGTGDEETELGWTNTVPGFPSLLAGIALIGAALVGRRKED